MTTGKRIKLKREELDLTLEDLAKKLGVNRSTVYRYECGAIEKMPISILRPIADALGVTPAYLMGWDDVDDVMTVQKEATEYQIMVEKYAIELIEKRLTEKQLKYLMKIADFMKEQGDEEI